MNHSAPPVALAIAGSDNSAGAGIQADLKTFGALGVYGLTAVTCVVAEVPGKVTAIQPVEPSIVSEQVHLSLANFPVGAIKTGMLYSMEILSAVCDVLAEAARKAFLVVDPVMVASSGDALVKSDVVDCYKQHLFPLADLITPNLDEAGTLLGRRIDSLDAMREAALELRDRHECGVLLKGGHLREPIARDLLAWKDGLEELTAPFVPGVSTHGTGCTYAAAIAAGVAAGLEVVPAVHQAKQFVSDAITRFFRWENDKGTVDALNHLDQPVGGLRPLWGGRRRF